MGDYISSFVIGSVNNPRNSGGKKLMYNTVYMLFVNWEKSDFCNFALFLAESVTSSGGQICVSISYHQRYWYYWLSQLKLGMDE